MASSDKSIPMLSVIVPTLNEEKYIERCLKAIRNQRYENYELIISDGNSLDRTVEISKKYTEKIIISPKRGIGIQQNIGAKNAKGNILIFVHADVVIKNALFEKIVKAVSEGYIGGGAEVEIEGTDFKYRLFNVFFRKLNNVLNRINIIASGDVLFFKKDAFIKNEGFRDVFFEDGDLFFRVRKNGRIIQLDEKISVSNRRFKKDFWKTMLEWIPLGFLILLGRPRMLRYNAVR